jgi:glycosyltransferase involved in cell wall biosynthesis
VKAGAELAHDTAGESKALRVLHVVASYFPAIRYGGPIVSVHALARAQVALGASVSVLTTNVNGPGDSEVALGTPVQMDGVAVWYFPSRWLRRLYFSYSMWRWMRANVHRFDVVHLHAVFLFPTNMAARVCEAARVPYVIAPRGMLVKELIDAKSSALKRAWIALFERRTLAKAACFHATSQLELSDARALGVPMVNSQLISNGVDAPPEATITSALADHQLAGDFDCAPGFLLFLGRLDRKKNVHLLIQAVAQIPGIRLVLAGEGEERGALTALVAQLGVGTRVQFLGELSAQAKWPWLRRARALALVSTNENFGNVAAEALVAGTPVVLSDGVGLAAQVQAIGAGWICEPRVEAITEAVIAAFSDELEAARRGQLGREWALENLSWPAVAAKTLHLYNKLTTQQIG